jgi:stage V sporulation protein AC
VGGLICVLGQSIADIGTNWLKMTTSDGYCLTAIVLVFLTAVLTGIGVFDKIGQYAGAGSFVPITGFANAMVSPAMEFKSEGIITGTATKLFTVAGPVLVYGISASVIYGVILYLLQ